MTALQAIRNIADSASRRAGDWRRGSSALAVGCLALGLSGLALAPAPDASSDAPAVMAASLLPLETVLAARPETPALLPALTELEGITAASVPAKLVTISTATPARHARPLRSDMQARAALAAVIRREVRCLALNIYFEARSEPEAGKRAVGHVVMNRVADPRFPDSVCAVVRQGGEWPLHRCQFSWWCDGKSDRPRDSAAWAVSKTLARQIYWGRFDDPTHGALWYHAEYVAPAWGRVLAHVATIGRHIFYQDRRAPGVQVATAYEAAATN